MRSIKPEFWADEDLAALPRDARLLYVGLWNLADEHGRLRGDPRYVKGQIFPYDDDLSAVAVDELLTYLSDAKKVVRYKVDGGRYLFLPNLAKHQRLDADKVPSRLPPPAETPDPDPSAPLSGNFPDESRPDPDSSALKHVAGSSKHVAGSREHVDAPASARTRRTRADAEFDRFWGAYPRREAKGAARKAWDKAILRADPDRILDAAQRYRDQPGRDPKFTAHAATWLNADRWTDEPAAANARASPPRGLVEHNGMRLKPETVANLEGRARFEAMDQQQLAIEGTAS
jgi:hypothetical protein